MNFRFLVAIALFSITASLYAQEQIYLWENGAPGFEDRKNEPELAKDWWVKNIHNPSVTAYFPDEASNTGAAVLIFPGGGHRELVFDAEGTDAAKFFQKLGVSAFVLKYRLAREENSPYKLPEHSREDAQRAMRFIRSNAQRWNIDKNRVGIMGFSAGGEVAAFIAYNEGKGKPKSKDPIERETVKPNFQILIYPGPTGIPEKLTKSAPPAFMLSAIDDACCTWPIIALLAKYKELNIPAEVHIYARGAHGFNMGQRSKERSLATWPDRLADWMVESGYAVKK